MAKDPVLRAHGSLAIPGEASRQHLRQGIVVKYLLRIPVHTYIRLLWTRPFPTIKHVLMYLFPVTSPEMGTVITPCHR